MSSFPVGLTVTNRAFNDRLRRTVTTRLGHMATVWDPRVSRIKVTSRERPLAQKKAPLSYYRPRANS